MTETQREVRSILVEITKLPENFDASANLYTDLGVPSMAAMELLLKLEERFGVSIPDDDFIEATSADSLAGLIDRLKVQ